MIYLGNGIYSDSGPDTLSHYGVLGMKWGVHRAKEHEKNMYRYNRAHGMSKKQAHEEYIKRMNDVKAYAKANRRNPNKTWKDIANISKKRARSHIKDYDTKLAGQRFLRGARAAATVAALGSTAEGLSNGYKAGKLAQASRQTADPFHAFMQDAAANQFSSASRDFLKSGALFGLSAGTTGLTNKIYSNDSMGVSAKLSDKEMQKRAKKRTYGESWAHTKKTLY